MMGDALHLVVDGIAAEPLEESQAQAFLLAVPPLIEMTVILGPAVYKTPGGWCGVSIIAESHISIHSEGEGVHIDVFSCKSFPAGRVVKYCQEELKLAHLRWQIVHRGWLEQ
jgi:S-adenosylmethionine/arginine decarboxylase-like enzyme